MMDYFSHDLIEYRNCFKDNEAVSERDMGNYKENGFKASKGSNIMLMPTLVDI